MCCYRFYVLYETVDGEYDERCVYTVLQLCVQLYVGNHTQCVFPHQRRPDSSTGGYIRASILFNRRLVTIILHSHRNVQWQAVVISGSSAVSDIHKIKPDSNEHVSRGTFRVDWMCLDKRKKCNLLKRHLSRIIHSDNVKCEWD